MFGINILKIIVFAQENERIGVKYKGIVTGGGSKKIVNYIIRKESSKLGYINHRNPSNFSENVH